MCFSRINVLSKKKGGKIVGCSHSDGSARTMPSFASHTVGRCATITTANPQIHPDVHVVRTTKKVVSRGDRNWGSFPSHSVIFK